MEPYSVNSHRSPVQEFRIVQLSSPCELFAFCNSGLLCIKRHFSFVVVCLSRLVAAIRSTIRSGEHVRKNLTKLALVVAGVAAFSGMTAMSAQAAGGPGTPGDGIPDATHKTASMAQCKAWGEALSGPGQKYAGYGCMEDGKGKWDLDLML